VRQIVDASGNIVYASNVISDTAQQIASNPSAYSEFSGATSEAGSSLFSGMSSIQSSATTAFVVWFASSMLQGLTEEFLGWDWGGSSKESDYRPSEEYLLSAYQAGIDTVSGDYYQFDGIQSFTSEDIQYLKDAVTELNDTVSLIDQGTSFDSLEAQTAAYESMSETESQMLEMQQTLGRALDADLITYQEYQSLVDSLSKTYTESVEDVAGSLELFASDMAQITSTVDDLAQTEFSATLSADMAIEFANDTSGGIEGQMANLGFVATGNPGWESERHRCPCLLELLRSGLFRGKQSIKRSSIMA